MGSGVIAQTGFSRVFIIPGRAGPTNRPAYLSCVKAGPVEQSFGDVEKIECPDPNRPNEFVQVAEVRKATERAKTNVTGRYAADVRSEILRLARLRCPVDVQIHIGTCSDPSQFDTFQKALVLESASLANWSSEQLGALESGERGKIDEKSDITAREFYEIVPLRLTAVAETLIINPLIDVAIVGNPSCGEGCDVSNSGTDAVFALSKAGGGTVSTAADVLYTKDGGATWHTSNVGSLGVAEEPTALAGMGDYLVVVSNATDSLHYVSLASLDGSGAETWTEVDTGFVGAKGPNAISVYGGVAFIVADGGYVYYSDNPSEGVSVVDAGVSTSQKLLAVHAFSNSLALAVGENGAIIYTADGTHWQAASGPIGVNLTTVAVKSPTEWWVGTSTGRLYYTTDAGVTWAEKPFSFSGTGSVNDLVFPTDSVGYLAHSKATPAGRILRTYDGGYTWVVLPEKSGGIPANDHIYALAASKYDPNLIYGAGMADNGTGGILVRGFDAIVA